MAIGVFELIRLLALACCKQCQHLLSGVQGERAPSRSRTAGLSGADLTVTLRKLYLDQRFACILDRGPARTRSALWAGNGRRFPINVEVCEVVASFRLIPMRFERGANQVHAIA